MVFEGEIFSVPAPTEIGKTEQFWNHLGLGTRVSFREP